MRTEGAPRYAWFGDDFTGASDTLATLAEANVDALLFLDVPTSERLARAGPLDAIGIAGATRAMDPAAIAATLAPVASFFATCGARLLHYKVCSTFDSAVDVGSIGAAVRTLRGAASHPVVAIVGGQPSLRRYCAFGNLFAAESEGRIARIDRHATMSVHPVTPMREADLRVHLASQGLDDVALVDWRLLEEAPDALDREVATHVACGPRAVLFDALRDAHVAAIGRVLWQAAQSATLLAVGASSVAQAAIAAWDLDRGRAKTGVEPATRPVLVFAGSLSPLTKRQIEAARAYRRVPVDAARLVSEPSYGESIGAAIVRELRDGRHVLAHTTPVGGAAATAEGLASTGIARASATLIARVVAQSPARRIGIAGGDTSSFAVQALAPVALAWAGRPSDGVVLCRARADDPSIEGLELMLKGGQMGPDDLFDRLVDGSR